MNNQIFFYGVVISRKDPDMLDRVKIRVHGIHQKEIPDEDLPWCQIMFPVTSASSGGVGSSHGMVEGTTVVGMFIDGNDNMQNFLVFGTTKGRPEDREYDPNGIFPKIINESDANRLARNSNVSQTCIGKIKNELETFPNIGQRKWKEPQPSYAAQYPYNFVYESESGHVIEIDSTKGAERYHSWHPSGNYHEIDPRGRDVQKIFGDSFTIIKKDGYIYIEGDANITVKGNVNQRIFGDKIEEIDGNFKKHVKGNYELIVDGTLRQFIKQKMYTVVRGVNHIWSYIIDMNNWKRRRPKPEEIR